MSAGCFSWCRPLTHSQYLHKKETTDEKIVENEITTIPENYDSIEAQDAWTKSDGASSINTCTDVPTTLPIRITDAKPVISETFPTAHSGTADIIGFGLSGVSIVRNSFHIQKRDVLQSFAYNAGGWRNDQHVRLLADTTGDKHLDIVGFGDPGVWVSQNNGDNTFGHPTLVVRDFGYSNEAGGWRIERHPRFMADIRNTGRADIVGFANAGVCVSLNNGNGVFASSKVVLGTFGYSQGWRVEKHLRFLADVNGNGLLDIVGFGNQDVYVAYNNGDGTFKPAKEVLTYFCYDQGWRISEHPRFVVGMKGAASLISLALQMTEYTLRSTTEMERSGVLARSQKTLPVIKGGGNGCGDIIGFGEAGVHVAINNGNGTFQPIKFALASFGYAVGWRVHVNPRFVFDLNGDGRADIVGFSNSGIEVAYNDGEGGFQPASTLISGFGANEG